MWKRKAKENSFIHKKNNRELVNEETELNLVFDRTFFTEQVYCSLGYKDYKFDEEYERTC